MALATRELELVIIARDNASATLARVGGALAILGGATARVGVEGLEFFAGATREAIDFRKQIALAFTQVEIGGATYEQVLEAVRESARNTAVPVEELTEAFFDVFSTFTDLQDVEQAQELVDGFAQSAVAGQAPIRDIGRAVIAWLNALNQAPTIENATRIMDVQFELVRKGAGTYTEFAGVIGKAIPPFVAAGQGVEELGGTLAFLTKNGLSAAEAATSASRGIELLFSPKAIKGLQELGIEVEDENGQFRLMDDLLGDVIETFDGLSDAERKIKFQEIFGTGRIQARRFFDLVLREGNFEEFLFLMGETRSAAGGVADAFDIMMAEPAVQLEMLQNRFRILRQEIGDAFIPFLTGKLMPALDRLLDWWEDLDEIQRNNLVRWAAFATIFITVGGAIAAVVGGLILFVGLLKAFVGSIGAAVLLGGGIATIIAAIAGAIALAIIDWEKFVEIFGPWWDTILTKMEPVIDWLKRNWPEAWAIAEDAYQTALSWLQNEWPVIWENFKEGIRDFMEEDWPVIWETAKGALLGLGDFFVQFWENDLREPVLGFITWIQERWNLIWEDLKGIFEGFVTADWGPLWDQVLTEVQDILPPLGELLLSLGKLVVGVFGVIVATVLFMWEHFGDEIIEVMRITVQVVGGLIEAFLLVAGGAADIITGLLTLDLGLALEGWRKANEADAVLVETVWEGLKDSAELDFGAMSDSFDRSVKDFDDFADEMEGRMDRLKRNISTDVFETRSVLELVSPQVRQSPSVNDLVQRGFDVMSRTVDRELHRIMRTARRLAPEINDTLAQGLIPQMPQRVPPVMAGPATSIGQNIENQVTIDKVISQADPVEIATEIAWKALNS